MWVLELRDDSSLCVAECHADGESRRNPLAGYETAPPDHSEMIRAPGRSPLQPRPEATGTDPGPLEHEIHYDPSSNEICPIGRARTGYGKVAVLHSCQGAEKFVVPASHGG